ncbi:MAG TPA: plasmid pRiA4b ORF-3 family protein [Bryobacteraceae bacterium]|jgi:hypothetical protein|nr:plasmid pRiA4b ORF-3 family protein [Bryobacteraceae bacterium]
MPAKHNSLIYQLRVALRDIEPAIWRRIQVRDDITLAQLHRVLQIVMGWEDYHLHNFLVGGRTYSVPDPDDSFHERRVIDERGVRLRSVITRVGTSFEYVYDFGDDWQHDILLEAILLPEAAAFYPHCVCGERCGPPEDVGGWGGYANYLEALADPQHEEHEQMLEWRGPFEPESFSVADVNRRLEKQFRAARKTKTAEDHTIGGTLQ